ncbi:hypothetical protein L9G74_01085 [Shewanella sp. C32]|uniref:DUF2946 domain-containing protein n=1 Tax=Shewanella electrica TaxID=515560 RepID=A0ABT2FFI1_9GAMM|nr:hypothetical protein [Shewanella electrica]MCH1925202.1 hypothetical protein [Shewanella electrica]MCS4555027.1 hypothetical protein [Shewanella electrica]
MVLWLTAWQSVAIAHATDQPLNHDHTHCLLCNFSSQPTTGPVDAPTPNITAVLVTVVAEPVYSQPTVVHTRRQQARAPPAFA